MDHRASNHRHKIGRYGCLWIGCLGLGLPWGLEAAPSAFPEPVPRIRIVALGRVESWSEEIRVAAAMTGRLAAVPVEEGDAVVRGALVATLENADHQARVLAAEATLRIAQAALLRLENGALPAERDEARAAVVEARALLEQSQREWARQQRLANQKLGSVQELDTARSAQEVAAARLERSRQHLEVLNSPARADERARAEAEVALASARVAEAQALFAKSQVRSPIDGVVLRKFRHIGEQVTELGDTPIVAVGDVSRLRVRAEVDEADIALLRAGQAAYVQATGYPGQRFPGRVSRIGQWMGRKSVLSDEPSEKRDSRVLEVMVDLESGTQLPVGLRVDVFIDIARREP